MNKLIYDITNNRFFYGYFDEENIDPAVLRLATDEELVNYEKNKELKKTILDFKKQLSETDYQAIKYAEGFYTAAEYQPIKEERQALRDQINELENA